MKTFKLGGIHPNDSKLTTDSAIVEMPIPESVDIILSQSIGAPSAPIVKPGDKVICGQKIAEPGGFVGAALHSPINGIVKKIDRIHNQHGMPVNAITIKHEDDQNVTECKPNQHNSVDADTLSSQDIITIVGENGIVGLGGATFPTKLKLTPPEGSTPEIVIINGAECEPYLTCDDILMQTHPESIILGTELIMKAVGVNNGVIAIEENKPKAIAILKSTISKLNKSDKIRVEILKKKYPQGGEKQLIQAVTGREIANGALPVSVGAIVDNIATAAAIFDAVYKSTPLTHRVVTVTGPELTNPGNFLCAIGTPIASLIEAAGGLPENSGKIIAGGPMMGRAVVNTDAPTTKGLSGILVLPLSQSTRKVAENCIRCGQCVDVCPMGLEPYLMTALAQNNDWDELKKADVMNCIECGSCSYSCPSNRPLLDYIRYGKQTVGKIIRQRNSSNK